MSKPPAKQPSLAGFTNSRTGLSHSMIPWRYFSALGMVSVMHAIFFQSTSAQGASSQL
jgi:hypothetical protein